MQVFSRLTWARDTPFIKAHMSLMYVFVIRRDHVEAAGRLGANLHTGQTRLQAANQLCYTARSGIDI